MTRSSNRSKVINGKTFTSGQHQRSAFYSNFVMFWIVPVAEGCSAACLRADQPAEHVCACFNTYNSHVCFCIWHWHSAFRGLTQCQAACAELAGCQGIEHNQGGRCELWTKSIQATRQDQDEDNCLKETR